GIAPEATNNMTVCKPKTRRSVRTGAKCTLYRAYAGPLPDPHMMASGEKLRDIHPQPGLCKMLHGVENLNLVDSKFGHVPFGSVLSYQCPPEISKDCIRHPDAPAFPQLPVDGYSFKFPGNYELNYKQQCHLESLKVTREISAAIETETRQQSECQLWTLVRKPRLTASRFREICHVRGESSAKALASRILRGTPQTAAMKRGLDLEAEILRQYSEFCDVSLDEFYFNIYMDVFLSIPPTQV
ncbi:uncharacterized protein LOC115582046 isoform X2, partial [Scomber scombrus]